METVAVSFYSGCLLAAQASSPVSDDYQVTESYSEVLSFARAAGHTWQ
jgi:hypothetical protein